MTTEYVDQMVTISKKEYEKLLHNVLWLECLESAGVDNWEGCSDAQELFDFRTNDNPSFE